MRHVVGLTLHNWGPYRGTHTLDLEPTVYAVVAQHQDDADRSNWVGKSWFLGAILFALTGEKPDSCKSEDGWITNGEEEGYIELTTDDGGFIRRARKRGRSTQLSYAPRAGQVQKQQVAQDNIYIAMGLNKDDLLATSFVRQKQIARLIAADPAERTGIVNGWVELGPLQKAESWLRDGLNQWLKEEKALDAGEAPDGDPKEMAAELTRVQDALAILAGERATRVAAISEIGEWRGHARATAELGEIREEGSALRVQVDEFEHPDVDGLSTKVDVTNRALSAALDREAQLKELVHDDWDGQCPLTCEECPAGTQVRALGASMATELSEAEIVLDEADKARDSACEAQDAATSLVTSVKGADAELVRLRTRAERLLVSEAYIAEHGQPPNSGDGGTQQLAALDSQVTALQRHEAELQVRIEGHAHYQDVVVRAVKRRGELEDLLRTCREAIAVVGRQGAQREVAETALFQIERDANALLQQSGIDLQVRVQWAREGRGLATHCDACGTAFPTSQRVKTCDVCGATRGPKLVEKLDIEPSDRSGAADDIAGLSFQLAASSWLRTRRSASWSSTCIDEPFGSLDVANCRALSTHLHAMIRGNYAFDQGFLVAHDAEVMESLPSRILITGGPNGASLEVA